MLKIGTKLVNLHTGRQATVTKVEIISAEMQEIYKDVLQGENYRFYLDNSNYHWWPITLKDCWKVK